MKKYMRNIFIYFLIIVLYVCALNIVSKIPNNLIKANIEKSLDAIRYDEKNVYREKFTDAIMLDLCYRSDEKNL